jgi:hypothetical protein
LKNERTASAIGVVCFLTIYGVCVVLTLEETGDIGADVFGLVGGVERIYSTRDVSKVVGVVYQ